MFEVTFFHFCLLAHLSTNVNCMSTPALTNISSETAWPNSMKLYIKQTSLHNPNTTCCDPWPATTTTTKWLTVCLALKSSSLKPPGQTHWNLTYIHLACMTLYRNIKVSQLTSNNKMDTYLLHFRSHLWNICFV